MAFACHTGSSSGRLGRATSVRVSASCSKNRHSEAASVSLFITYEANAVSGSVSFMITAIRAALWHAPMAIFPLSHTPRLDMPPRRHMRRLKED